MGHLSERFIAQSAWGLLLWVAALVTAGCTIQPIQPDSRVESAAARFVCDDTPALAPVYDLLRFVPVDDPDYLDYVAIGLPGEWYAATGEPRDLAWDDVLAANDAERMLWTEFRPRQTSAPRALGNEFSLAMAQDASYGINFQEVDYTLDAGTPPDKVITVLRGGATPASIEAALEAMGYVWTEMAGATLYTNPPGAGQGARNTESVTALTGALDTVALLTDGTLLVGKSVEPVLAALDAQAGNRPALIDDLDVCATFAQLDPLNLSVEGGARLVSVIFLREPLPDDLLQQLPLSDLGDFGATVQSELEGYAVDPLPPYNLTALAVFRTEEDTYLKAILVLPEGIDGAPVAETLARRMENAPSLLLRARLGPYWSLSSRSATGGRGMPSIAAVMMQANPDSANGMSWQALVFLIRDLLFLTPGEKQ